MNVEDESRLKLIEKIFHQLLNQTQSDIPQLSRDYFERFTQLLNQTFQKHSQLRSSIETIISSIVHPYHPSNTVTLEYQLRLIGFCLREHLHLNNVDQDDYLHKLFQNRLLTQSSILRHLSLQIAIGIYENQRYQTFDEHMFIELFSCDRNHYVCNACAQFLATYILKQSRYELLEQIRIHSQNSDLFYRILLCFDQDQQRLLIEKMKVYDDLSDSSIVRTFVLKTVRFLAEEDKIISYLNEILEKSLSDYVHMLLNIMSSRSEHDQSISRLAAFLEGLFLYMNEIDFEEIDPTEQSLSVSEKDKSIESICSQLYEANVRPIDLQLILLDSIQPMMIHSSSFLYQLDFYPSTILSLIKLDHHDDKILARLIRCYEKLQEFQKAPNIIDTILSRLQKQTRTNIVYQSLFNLILNPSNEKYDLECIYLIIEKILVQNDDKLLQWENQDCLFYFLVQLIKQNRIVHDNNSPTWLTSQFLQSIVDRFVYNGNEYNQGNLIDLLAVLVQHDFISPFDNYLTDTFVHFTQHSLGDVVRSSLARAWFIMLTKTIDERTGEINYRFSFGSNTNFDSLLRIVTDQVPLLIGDGGYETEEQCLQLIEFIRNRKVNELDGVLEFLASDGCSNEIKGKARRLLRPLADDIIEDKYTEILEDELMSILHWLEHPDEHCILDCD